MSVYYSGCASLLSGSKILCLSTTVAVHLYSQEARYCVCLLQWLCTCTLRKQDIVSVYYSGCAPVLSGSKILCLSTIVGVHTCTLRKLILCLSTIVGVHTFTLRKQDIVSVHYSGCAPVLSGSKILCLSTTVAVHLYSQEARYCVCLLQWLCTCTLGKQDIVSVHYSGCSHLYSREARYCVCPVMAGHLYSQEARYCVCPLEWLYICTLMKQDKYIAVALYKLKRCM